VGDGVILR